MTTAKQALFKFAELNSSQRSRYETAKALFYRIQQENFEKEVERLKTEGTLTPDLYAQLEAKSKLHQPGEHSALFLRLLNGDNPLEFPPPLIYGYPCYELVQQNFPMIVEMGGWVVDRDKQGKVVKVGLLLSHHVWSVQYLSAEAKALIYFERLHKSPSFIDGKWDQLLQPNEKKELRGLLDARPSFRVKDPHWGSYEVYIDRKTVTGDLTALDRADNVSFSDVGTNPVVLQQTADSPWVTLEVDAWFIRRI